MPASQAEIRLAAEGGDDEAISHNLLGQRLGRKGRDTRERILGAAARLLDGPADAPLSMSAVARDASVGLTTLYLYFKDLTEILLALLEPVIASGEDAYVARLRTRWPDATLGAECRGFVHAYHAFWEQHGRLLHTRNNFADAGDARMRDHRIASSLPMIRLLEAQMDAAANGEGAAGTASALMTMIERVATVTTDADLQQRAGEPGAHTRATVEAVARILELAIADRRGPGESGGAARA